MRSDRRTTSCCVLERCWGLALPLPPGPPVACNALVPVCCQEPAVLLQRRCATRSVLRCWTTRSCGTSSGPGARWAAGGSEPTSGGLRSLRTPHFFPTACPARSSPPQTPAMRRAQELLRRLRHRDIYKHCGSTDVPPDLVRSFPAVAEEEVLQHQVGVSVRLVAVGVLLLLWVGLGDDCGATCPARTCPALLALDPSSQQQPGRGGSQGATGQNRLPALLLFFPRTPRPPCTSSPATSGFTT